MIVRPLISSYTEMPKHGGNRNGAGRKATGRRYYKIWLRPGAWRALKRRAKPKPVGEYLEETIQ